MNSFDQEIMARTAMGEARGEGDEGMQAVMWTGMNRFNSKRWFARATIAATFLFPKQYDCWMPSDPNFHFITEITDAISFFTMALVRAADIIAGHIPDPTLGATHYFSDSIAAPNWVADATFTKKIGRHLFYKDVA